MCAKRTPFGDPHQRQRTSGLGKLVRAGQIESRTRILERPECQADTRRGRLLGRAFASAESRCPAFEQRTPPAEPLLAALPPREYERLLPELGAHCLAARLDRAWRRRTGSSTCTSSRKASFPACTWTRNGASTEFAMTGSEGVVGCCVVPGWRKHAERGTGAGRRLRLPAELERACRRVQARWSSANVSCCATRRRLITQTGQIAACNRLHSVDQASLAGWIMSFSRPVVLYRADRHAGDARRLARRTPRKCHRGPPASWQEAGLIHCSRGQHCRARSALDSKHGYASAMRSSNGSIGVCCNWRASSTMPACTVLAASPLAFA